MAMKKTILIFVMVLLQTGLIIHTASAHPGSGIVVDKFGNVYFIYSGVGVVKISPKGNLTYIHKAKDGHWICLDERGVFSRAQPKYFERITPNGTKPTLIYAGGGSPIVVNSDGNFYYCGGENGDMHPGAKSIIRETPQKQQITFAPLLEKSLDELDDGITALNAGPDGSLYIGGWNSVLKVTLDGKISTLIHPVIISDCDEDPADHREVNRGKPLLRGIAIDSTGTVYAAATSCHCLLRITIDGKVEPILKSERPWAPTGLALRNGNIYVLEYTNANGPATEKWLPRIRKLGKDGKVTIIADFSSNKNSNHSILFQPGE
jgi:hypothetical protein